MLQKILVAVDDSKMSRDVFEHALMLAQATKASLGLLYVTDPDATGDSDLPLHLSDRKPYLDEGEPEPRCFVGHFEGVEKSLFGIYVEQANALGVSTECVHCFGDPEQAICDFASVWEADLLVMGRRGRSGVAEFFLGSVSNYVVHHAPCSVCVVHAPSLKPIQSQPIS